MRHVKLDPRDVRTVYASAFNNAIHRSAPALENGDAAFKPVYAIVGFNRFQDLAMFDLTVQNSRTRMYVYNGTASLNDQALYRLDNADVPASTLVTGSGASLSNTGAWIKLTSNSVSDPGSTSRRLCSSQCFYDLVVAVPQGQPDTVILGGVATSDLGEPTIRSTNAGQSFFGFGNDAQNPRNTSHVDVRSVVFHPKNPRIAFVGSDGGVVRNDGAFVNNAGRCQAIFGSNPPTQCGLALSDVPRRIYFMNKGLQTLQFYNVAVDPRAPLTRLLGGLQDNSTIWTDGTGDPRVWKALFPFGDGTSASGFHPARSEVLFASFQSNRFFTNFRNGQSTFWVRTDEPIVLSSERATVTASTGRQFITFDLVNPNTQFTAFQHVWRTQNNGGDQTFLEANCRFQAGEVASATCGDWVPLGVPYPFPLGSTPDFPGRQPGDLTSLFYGGDRAGGIVVAAERTPADAGTLWAATNFGRLFVSKNADGPAAAVEFVRIDPPNLPNRFVTRVHGRSREPQRRVHLVFGVQLDHAVHAGARVSRGLQPGPAPGDIHVARLRPRRYPDQHHRVRRPARGSLRRDRLRAADSSRRLEQLATGRGRFPGSAHGRSRNGGRPASAHRGHTRARYFLLTAAASYKIVRACGPRGAFSHSAGGGAPAQLKEDSESASAGARASGGGAPRALKKR